MSTKEVTFQNYNAETGEFFTDTKVCTVVTSSYEESTLGSRDGKEHWYVVESNVNLGWFNVRGDVHLILADGCTLTADEEESDYAAVNVEDSDFFTIYGQAAGTGKLVAKGGKNAAGIGGDKKEDNGHITINGGIVEAYGGSYAAGIGGGKKAYGSDITINGGTVTAEGGYEGAGIGGGYGGEKGSGFNITITGGKVTATGGDYAAGIGGGDYGYGYNITITGGDVSAYGGYNGAGIGGGYDASGHDITINGGTVMADGGTYGSGIGGGDWEPGYNITINGGNVTAYGDYSAGIGGGYSGDGYNIIINNGTINAYGDRGAGIGSGGDIADAHDITINGGVITAEGQKGGAGIGGGNYGDGSNIEINDGTIIASAEYCEGSAIGSGNAAGGTDITINGGNVTAEGGTSGIGGDIEGSGITINGGDITALGKNSGAAIGSSYTGNFITINGGKISATGASYAAGIGGGHYYPGRNIKITGGNITATTGCDSSSDSKAATGIGSGKGNALGVSVRITGGKIWATTNEYATAIGYTKNADVYVSGAVVVKADQTNGTTTISHGDGEDIAEELADKRYAQTQLYNTTVSSTLTTSASGTYTQSGGTVGNGGYYSVTTTGILNNVGYIITFDGTSVTGNGGAIYNEGGVSLNNVTFMNCHTANGQGGAIYNKGGEITLQHAAFDANTSIYGGVKASGGAVFMNDGTLTVKSGSFTSNQSWYQGGAIVIDGGASATLSQATCSDNSSRDGGMAAILNGTLAVTDSTLTGNKAVARGIDGGLGGAFLVAQNGVLSVGNVTFNGNTATAGGAIYAEAGSIISLTGDVHLATDSDTIVTAGTLNWDLSGKNGSIGYLDNYALASVSGNHSISVNANLKTCATYTLASHATSVAGQSFTLTGIDDLEDKTIVVCGDAVSYNRVDYTLWFDDDALMLTAVCDKQERDVIDDTEAISSCTYEGISSPDANGGVLLVEDTGDLTLSNAEFSHNSGQNGGAIYNAGKTTLKNVTFTGNTSADGASGALYNTGTLTLNGAVTLATDTDTIFNDGGLVWNITASGCGYISDWTKLAGTGTLTIIGTQGSRFGQYVLADNAASANGTVFALNSDSIQIELTVNGDIVTLDDYYFAQLKVNSDNELLLTVDAKRIQVLSGESFTIQDGTQVDLSGRRSLDDDGGVICVSADATLDNIGAARIAGSSITGAGGAMYSEGTVCLANVTFQNNHADKNAGAIFSLGDITITDSIFDGNSSGGWGGAFMHGTGALSLTNVTFKGNTAASGGGAIYSGTGDGYGTVVLDNVVFDGNAATSGNGGAIYNNNYGTIKLLGDVQLKTSTDTIYLGAFSNMVWVVDGAKNGYLSNYAQIGGTKNEATLTIDAAGGAAMTSYILAGNALQAVGQTFTLMNNTAIVNGASLLVSSKYYTLYVDGDHDLRLSITQRTVVNGTSTTIESGLVFTSNSTAYVEYGGAIEVKNNGVLTAEGTEAAPLIFKNSVATRNGGAVCVTSGTATLSDASFSANLASYGGALYVGAAATVTIRDTTFSLNMATAGGAIYIAVGGTLNVEGTLTLATATDTIYNDGTLNWRVSAEEAESSGYTLCDSSMLTGNGTFVITIIDDETEDSRGGSDTYTMTDLDSTAARKFIIRTTSGKTIGTIGEDESLQYGDSYIGLVVEDGELKLAIVNKPTGLAGDADGIVWETTAETSMMQISDGESGQTLALVTEDKGVNFYALTEGSYDVKVKNSLGNTWSDAIEISAEKGADTPTAWTSQDNGRTDLFFANASGVWKEGYVARHRGSVDEWDGTLEKVSLTGKNKLADTFSGSTQNSSVLVLTNDANGDALFVDDIYTAFPDDAQARIAQIKEVRAGAGDDIVDMTSQRFEYNGHGIIIRGGSGNDTIWANNGRNYLFGDAGDDRIVGASGNDVIVGGIGNDSMHGGGGDDVFCFGSAWGNDTVEQLADGTVTLWFASGSEDNWNQATRTYTDGENSVVVKGASEVTLKFGGADKVFERLANAGAFDDITSDTTLDANQKGLLALV